MPVGSNQDSLRRRNLSSVLRQVHRAGELTRSSLTSSTGLNRSTIGTLVGELEERGLVVEGAAVVTGSPGRPSTSVRPRSDGVAVVAVEIQVSRLGFSVISLGGVVHEEEHLDRLFDDHDVLDIVELIGEFVDRAVTARPTLRIVGLGVSVAGIVRRSDGFVHLAPNLEWRDVPLGELLASRLQDRNLHVVVGNEADLGVLAEHVRGAGAGASEVVYISGEIGTGGGIVTGGKPLLGAAGYAGEVGHMVVRRDGLPCHCGSRGCWETEVGQRALLRHMGWAQDGGREAVDAIIAQAAAGNARASAALEEVGGWLGVGISNLINVLNPQRVVLGGVFAKAYPHMIDAIRAELDRCTLRPARAVAALSSATLGEDSSLLGAGELALERVLADPASVPVLDEPTMPSTTA